MKVLSSAIVICTLSYITVPLGASLGIDTLSGSVMFRLRLALPEEYSHTAAIELVVVVQIKNSSSSFLVFIVLSVLEENWVELWEFDFKVVFVCFEVGRWWVGLCHRYRGG